MTKFAFLRAAVGVSLIAGGTVSATAQSDARYDPRDPRFNGELPLRGAGVPLLYPALRETPRGRAFVIPNFDANGDGRIDEREARDANRAFERIAGTDPAHYVWDGPAVVVTRPAPPVVVVGEWDRAAMRGYHFRQTRRGAMMALADDVLFASDSDVLRPGAIDTLRPLAAYLRANPGVRVAIDGHTDSRGTDAHNQDLSERRAASVRSAFDAMDVTRARFTVAGHGERQPVATNATAAGMRLNRRVEVTLLGQRADRF